MDCLTRVLCYIRRKKMKSVLLLFLFLVINSMVLGILGIRRVSLRLEEELRKNVKLGGKADAEELLAQRGY